MIEYLAGSSAFAIGGGFGYGAKLLLDRRDKFRLCDASFESYIQNTKEGYYRSSLDGKQMFGNKALVKLNGYDTEEELLAAVGDIATEWYVEPERRGEFKKLLEENGYVEDFVSEIYRHKTRERIWISETARLVCDKAGNPTYYEGTVREFTDTMKRLELEALHHKLSEQVPGVLFQARVSPRNKLTIPYFSSGFEKMMGSVPGDFKADGSFLLERMHHDDFEGFLTAVERATRKQTRLTHEFRIRHRDGKEAWIEVNAAPEMEDDGFCLWHGVLIDISDKKTAESRINSLAFYDPLTQLPNRRLLMERITTAITAGQSTKNNGALLFVDVDNFKSFNDTRGHGFADKLLIEISKRLRSCIGDEGVLGHLGGDEFLVLLTDLGTEEPVAAQKAEEIARRILAVVDSPCMVESELMHPTCSIGVAIVGSRIRHTSEAMKQADSAMSTAKDSGKNCYRFFDHQMQQQLDNSVNLMADFRKAIGTDQLSLHYQMQVDGDNEIVGAEGLLRWTHPTDGAISPGQFIPFAEQSGLILLLTDWLLKEAFDTLEGWSNHPQLSKTRLSINISAKQFHEQSFVEKISKLLESHNVQPDRLVLEMTEHVLTADLRKVTKVMHALRKLGVGFSLDDFGTGYSSLTHMRDLPFDEVKIDGKFVCDLEKNEGDQAIVRSIVAMAHALNMKTVAEWVESDCQREFLAKEGCDALQGFLFGPAVPLKVFEEMAVLPLMQKACETTGVPQHLAVSA